MSRCRSRYEAYLSVSVASFFFQAQWDRCDQRNRREEAQFVPKGVTTVCCKPRPQHIANMLTIKNSSMLMISVSGNQWCQLRWTVPLLPFRFYLTFIYSGKGWCSQSLISTFSLSSIISLILAISVR